MDGRVARAHVDFRVATMVLAVRQRLRRDRRVVRRMVAGLKAGATYEIFAGLKARATYGFFAGLKTRATYEILPRKKTRAAARILPSAYAHAPTGFRVFPAALCTPVAALVLAAVAAQSRLPDVRFVATPSEAVDAMLAAAKVTSTDVVYDLGCGDGRIVIAAARKYGARGVGIDIVPERIAEANANAEAAGVSHLVRFVQADLLTTDLRDATVVALYLSPSMNDRIKPRLLNELRGGARVVSYVYDMVGWTAERRVEVDGRWIFVWTVPRRAT